MTNAPERIWIDDARTYSATFFSAGIPYVRADLFDALTAERDAALALVAAAYEAAAQTAFDHTPTKHGGAPLVAHVTGATIEREIRALTPADALAAQAARDERMRAEGRAEAETLIVELKHAIFWCGGSTDFSEGGQAREGWLKICMPLLGGSGQR